MKSKLNKDVLFAWIGMGAVAGSLFASTVYAFIKYSGMLVLCVAAMVVFSSCEKEEIKPEKTSEQIQKSFHANKIM